MNCFDRKLLPRSCSANCETAGGIKSSSNQVTHSKIKRESCILHNSPKCNKVSDVINNTVETCNLILYNNLNMSCYLFISNSPKCALSHCSMLKIPQLYAVHNGLCLEYNEKNQSHSVLYVVPVLAFCHLQKFYRHTITKIMTM